MLEQMHFMHRVVISIPSISNEKGSQMTEGEKQLIQGNNKENSCEQTSMYSSEHYVKNVYGCVLKVRKAEPSS